MASRAPVDPPDGTAARPIVPDSSSTSHSTVGLPRESRISRPMISTIALMVSSRYDVEFVQRESRRVGQCASQPFDDHHVHHGRTLALVARNLVFGGAVPLDGVFVAVEFENDTARKQSAF